MGKFKFKNYPPDKLSAFVEAMMAAKKQSSEPSPSAKRKIWGSSVADQIKKAKVVAGLVEVVPTEKVGIEALPQVQNSQSRTDLEKCRLRKEIEDLRGEKLGLEEKLNISRRKCEEKDERLVRMGKEIEDLWREKLGANQTIKELKSKEIEATQTIDKLRVRLETALATMLRVNVEDLSKLINGPDSFSAAATNAEEEEHVNLPNSEKGESYCLGNDNVNADAEDGVVMHLKFMQLLIILVEVEVLDHQKKVGQVAKTWLIPEQKRMVQALPDFLLVLLLLRVMVSFKIMKAKQLMLKVVGVMMKWVEGRQKFHPLLELGM